MKYRVVLPMGTFFLQDSLTEGDYLLEAFTAHSFYNDSSEFKAIRKIIIRKDINPRPSFTADFDKVRYKTGDTINVTITSLSEDHKPLYAEIDAELLQGDRKLGQARSITNQQGEAIFAFVLQGAGEGLRVNAVINYLEKEEQLDFIVPNKKGNPIQFGVFPEGGNLVTGIKSKLAFNAVNIDGFPLDVKGTLYENDKPLVEFNSVHAGMGSFDLTPVAGKNYHIRLTEPETDSTFVLPEILPEWIAMNLAGRDKEYLDFIVSQSQGMPKSTVYLRGQMRGMVCCMAGGRLNRELKIRIPLKEFPQQGIAEFTLFNENMFPVAERLVYIHPNKKLYIEVQPDKEKYETREKATLKIKVTDETGQPVQANLGVSVFDKLYQDAREQENIQTRCFLSEQLKGRIYDPAYYFDERNKDRKDVLDLLLLTQGWRRYIWEEENLKGQNKQTVITDGTAGEVHFTKKLKQAPEGEQFVMAFNPGENEVKDFIVSGSDGRFMVSPIHLKTWQGGYVYLKPMGDNDFKPRISMVDPFQQITEAMKTKEISYPLHNNMDTLNKEPAHPFVAGPNVIELGEVTIKGKIIKPFRDKYMGHLDSLAKLNLCIDYIAECGMLNCPFCGKRGKPIEGKSYVKWVSKRNHGPVPYAFTADETEEIREYHYPKYTEEELLKLNNLYRVKGYYDKREFYQPNYDKGTENAFIPDSRNTVLWAPMVLTDDNGEATLKFYCSDINTSFVGIIEGISEGGLPGTGTFEFKVRKTKPFKWEK